MIIKKCKCGKIKRIPAKLGKIEQHKIIEWICPECKKKENK